MCLDCIRRDLEPLKHFPVKDVCRDALVNEDLVHHEIGNHNGDNHEVPLVDRVDALEVSVDECYRSGDNMST